MDEDDSEHFMENFTRRLMKVTEGGKKVNGKGGKKKKKKKKNKASSEEDAAAALPYLWMCYSVTMQAYECNARIEGTNVFKSFSERQVR